MRALLLLTLTLLSTGCAFAPLTNLYTARSTGKGNVDLNAGAYTSTSGGVTPLLKIFVGLSQDFDLGFNYEVYDYGFLAKYSFINNQEQGLSLAAVGSLGASVGGSYWYLGPVLSYKTSILEPYVIARFNQISYSGSSYSLGSEGTINVTSGSYSYLYYTLGTFVHFSRSVSLGVEYNFFGSTVGATYTGAGFVAAAFLFRL